VPWHVDEGLVMGPSMQPERVCARLGYCRVWLHIAVLTMFRARSVHMDSGLHGRRRYDRIERC
jgi:hypothetical protein